MRPVYIIATGQTQVKEHWDRSLRELAVESIRAALQEAHIEEADALYVGNMLAGELAGQEQLAALVADFAGLRGMEAMRIEAACGSGAAAVRLGYLAVASGLHDVVIVSGVEKMTDSENGAISAALASASDADYEALHGLSFVALNALLMRRYMHEFQLQHEDFAAFSINAHRNACGNAMAMFQRPISEEEYSQARMVADPIAVLDCAPIADGAATLVLASEERARALSSDPVPILASAVASDSIALHNRKDPLVLQAAHASAHKAYLQAGVSPEDINLFELHDAFSIMAALALEACGFAPRGGGVTLAQGGEITLEGRIPISTLGGLKGRGHPVGASGTYQMVELVQQLRGRAGVNQLPDCRLGMAQSLGGTGAIAITHILGAPDWRPRR